MFRLFELKLAFSYLQIKKASGLIALFSLIGIMLGVATLIIVMSVMNGFKEEFTRYLVGVNGHLNIREYNGIKNYSELLPSIKSIPAVRAAFPIIEKQCLLMYDNEALGIMVKGINKEDFLNGPLTSKSIIEGGLDNFTGIIIGDRLAENLALSVGSTINLFSSETFNTILGPIPRIKKYTVIAIFSMGMLEYDSNLIYMPLNLAQQFFNLQDLVNVIDIFLHKKQNLKSTQMALHKTLGMPVHSWENMQSSYFNVLEIQKNVMFLILLLIILVAAFNIISSLIMLVQDKKKDIAVLTTLGATPNSILRIFILCGTLISILGTSLGVGLGVLIASNLDSLQKWLSAKMHLKLFDPLFYFLNSLPSIVLIEDVIKISLLSLGLAFLATLLPARQASRLDPITILKES